MTTEVTDLTKQDAYLTYLLRLADDRLILGQRMSEWCGHGPQLEEDLAMANMALDLIGHATALYEYAAEIEGEGHDEDHLPISGMTGNLRTFSFANYPKVISDSP